MKILHYNTKNEEGRYIIIKYYPSDEETDKIMAILLSRNRPQQIEFHGNLLKTSQIEIFDDKPRVAGNGGSGDKGRYNLDNPTDREKIRRFEDSYSVWQMENGEMTFENYLQDMGCVAKDRHGNAAYPITNAALFFDLWKQYNAWNDLRQRRKYAEKMESESLDSLIT